MQTFAGVETHARSRIDLSNGAPVIRRRTQPRPIAALVASELNM